MTRTRVAVVVGSVLVAGVAVALSAAALSVGTQARSTAYRGSEPPAGIGLGDFALRDQNRRILDSDDLRGRVTVLTFLDSQCTESCPVIAWTVARALDSLKPEERREVRAAAISTDPAEDTSRSVRQFLARNRAGGRLLYLGGGQPEDELRNVWSEFKILSSLESGEDALHSAPVRIYDRGGTWVATLHAGADLTEANLIHDIRVALAATPRQS